MSNIVVKQVKSAIGRSESQVKVLRSLGLGKIGKTKELQDIPTIRGMIAKVAHLVEIVKE